MADIATIWNADDVSADWAMNGADLQTDDTLQTAALISIFTDRRAGPDDVIPDGTNDARGWWGDDPEHPIGSRLWLLNRAKRTNETLQRAKDYIIEALQWIIDDGAAARIDVEVEWATPTGLLGRFLIWDKDGRTVATQFNYTWSN